jgi:chorismate synthase
MSTIGNNLKISLFGASHEKYIGVTIHNFPPGFFIDKEFIGKKLSLRRGLNRLTSKRFEDDEFEIISGVFNDYSTGAPLTILIKNSDVRSSDYEITKEIARPSHGDYTSYIKSHGFNDYRGGGVTSGRLTSGIVAAGAICEAYLRKLGVIIASRLKSVYNIIDEDVLITKDILLAYQEDVLPVNSHKVKDEMLLKISELRDLKDSVGGIVETYVLGLPAGLGNPFFDSVESVISHLIFSIPGVKGIEFGQGFKIASMLGSDANDEIEIVDGKVNFKTNNNGGINAGITNGDIVNFRTAFKPTSSIEKKQNTINFKNNTNETIELLGRHDVVIAIKGLHVVNAITAIGFLDMYLGENR